MKVPRVICIVFARSISLVCRSGSRLTDIREVVFRFRKFICEKKVDQILPPDTAPVNGPDLVERENQFGVIVVNLF